MYSITYRSRGFEWRIEQWSEARLPRFIEMRNIATRALEVVKLEIVDCEIINFFFFSRRWLKNEAVGIEGRK